MNWLFRTATSSIGKKQIMAVTGLGFCVFVATHLIGNLTIYGGKALFLSYVEHLHALGYLVTVAEWGLVLFAALHVVTGLLLFWENLRARPVRYAVKKRAGGRTLGSATAPYTGVLILGFITVHLIKFRFVEKNTINDFVILTDTFSRWGWALFYVVGVIIVAVHVSHGFWSGFQTLGLNHPRYMPFVMRFGLVLSVILGVGFASIPIFILSTI